MVRKRRRDSGREQFWRAAVAGWEKSGQSVRAYCSGRGLSEASFYSWRRVLREQDAVAPPKPTLVPLRVVSEAVLEVVLPTGLAVRVPVGVETDTVVALIAALRAASC